MNKRYTRFTEDQILRLFGDGGEDVEYAVCNALSKGYELVSVSYVGGCRASGHHVYHFLY